MARYTLKEKAPLEVHEALASYTELVRDLLFMRGISDTVAAEDFLSPSFEKYNHDPFLLPDMEKGVTRILAAIEKGEKICIWSDYDCDGIPGAALLHDFFKLIGYTNFINYIPHRHEEGYGLNEKGIEKLAKDGVTLMLTVDSGITDLDPVLRANALGVDVIVTDHHLPRRKKEAGIEVDDLPQALAVINPKRADNSYPFDGLAGTGVAWKLVQAVLLKNRFGVAEGKEKWLLDVVAIATVADMMPLIDENRALVHYGLIVLRKTRRPGLHKLYALARTKAATLTEDDIGFGIAPRINAASRMDMPRDAFELLVEEDLEKAGVLAKHLDRINNQRKGVVAATVKEIQKRLADEGIPEGVIVMGNPDWRPGLLGLVANSIAETHGRCVFLWGREGGDTIKGSCRSDGTTNLVELMAETKDIFIDFGGHKYSGGFSVKEDEIHNVRTRLAQAFEALQMKGKEEEVLVVDRELALEDVTRSLRELSRLAPFGMGNEKPLFVLPNVLVASVRPFGKVGNHLELSFAGEGNVRAGGIAFFTTAADFTKEPEAGLRVDALVHIEKDWNGRPRLRVVDCL